MFPGVFELNSDGDDIVTLNPSDGHSDGTVGWVNVGLHAVKLSLGKRGDLLIESYLRSAEHNVLGSVLIAAATVEQEYRAVEGEASSVATLVKALRELGFGEDEPINGGDVVDVIAKHFDQLCAEVEHHEQDVTGR